MDCVTRDGTAVLGYASDLVLGGVHLRHSSVLVSEQDGTVASRQTFLRGTLPTKLASCWEWKCPALGLCGEWAPLTPPAAPICLYEPRPGKDVVWHCIAPLADVHLSLKGRELEGKGYLECLSMRLEPWKLPVDTLLWGRYHGDDGQALTWIVWKGGNPLALLLENERPVPVNFVMKASGKALDLAGHKLNFGCDRVLRSGDISGTALRYCPSMAKRLMPDSILQLRETKWAGRAHHSSSGVHDSGFAIHEIVRFQA